MRNFYWEIYSGIFPSSSILIPSLYICHVQESPMQKAMWEGPILWPARELVLQAEQRAGGVETTAALTLLPILIPSITNTGVCSLAVSKFQEGKSVQFFSLATSVQWKYNSTSTSHLWAVPATQVVFVGWHGSFTMAVYSTWHNQEHRLKCYSKISNNSTTWLSNSFSVTPALSPKIARSWLSKLLGRQTLYFSSTSTWKLCYEEFKNLCVIAL